MKAVIQRVIRASVLLKETGERREISSGLVILLGIALTDTPADARALADKIIGLRLFEDAQGKMNLSVAEVGGAMLVISQFTLYGDTRKGRRPSFAAAAPSAAALPLYHEFLAAIRASQIPLVTGEFGADMLVEIANDGPVTLILDST